MEYRGRRGVDPEKIKEIRALYGFDKGPVERYFLMLGRFARFDLGESYFQHRSVWELIKSKLPVSISIGLWTFFLTYLISVPLGIAKAVRAGSRFDLVSSVIVLVGYAIPGFVLGVLLLVLFGGGTFFQWFPIRGLTSDNWGQFSLPGKVTDYLWHIALPITASVVGSFAVITMLTKNAFLEEIRKQYVLTARSKGLSERRVLWKHIFRNAMIPLVTGFPAAFIGAFFTGSLLIEKLFSLDGMGLMSYEAVVQRDYPVVLGTLYVFTLIGLATRLISDVLRAGRSAHPFRRDRAVSDHDPVLPRIRPSRQYGGASRRPPFAVAAQARMAAFQAAPAGVLEPDPLCRAVRAEPAQRGDLQ